MPPTRKKRYQRKIILAKHGKRTKWAPVWAVLRKFGPGKRVHPSRITRIRRSWRRTKLKVKPRKVRKRHLG